MAKARNAFNLKIVDDEDKLDRLSLVPAADEVAVADGTETFIVKAAGLDAEVADEFADADAERAAYDAWCAKFGARTY